MIEIREVKTKRDLHKFVTFPIELYKDNKYFVPPLVGDDKKDFDPKKNPSYEKCESKSFLAYKDGKLVGRICGLHNVPADEKFNTKRLRFRHFDVIDDIEVTKALFKAVRDYGLSLGLDEIEGPNGFTDMDKEGMLIEGFEEMNLFFTYYNAPYYKDHMEAIGLAKKVDWFEYRITIPQEVDERLEKISKLVLRRGFKVVKVKNHKELNPYIQKAFKTYNEAFAPLYGTVELSPELVDYYMGSFLPLLKLDYISIIEDKNGEIAGFAAVVPSLGKASQACKGRLFPFGFINLLKALNKNDTIDMLLIAVKPELQGQGVNALLMLEIQKTCIKYGIKYAETGPELEVNTLVRGQWEKYEHILARKRRLFISRLDELKVD